MNEHEEFIKRNYPRYPWGFTYAGVWTLTVILMVIAEKVVVTLWSQLNQ